MNTLKFLKPFTNENLPNDKASRRDSFNVFEHLGKNAALAAVPFGIAGLTSSRVFATDINPTPSIPIGTLQLAVVLEYLVKELYNMGLASGTIPPAERDEKIFMQISINETAHITFLIARLGGAEGTNFVAKPTIDFTVNKVFDPFYKNRNWNYGGVRTISYTSISF